jgi:hypothetical protein
MIFISAKFAGYFRPIATLVLGGQTAGSSESPPPEDKKDKE